MSDRKFKRLKLGKGLTRSRAYEVLEARMAFVPERVRYWKYNPVTGWVSVKFK